jgi:hypothetical protein
MNTNPPEMHCVPCARPGGFIAPPDACVSYQTLHKAPAEFAADLHQHIHFENNILFPRAIAMEVGGLIGA